MTELVIGDCFDEPAGSTTVSDVQHQPCTSAHDAEVVFIIHDTSASYPGVDAFRTAANAQCPDQATAYLGTDFNSRADIGGGFLSDQRQLGQRRPRRHVLRRPDRWRQAVRDGQGPGNGTAANSPLSAQRLHRHRPHLRSVPYLPVNGNGRRGPHRAADRVLLWRARSHRLRAPRRRTGQADAHAGPGRPQRGRHLAARGAGHPDRRHAR